MQRPKQLFKLLERVDPVDIVIVGGGAVGLGAALDAAARGLSTVLLERADFGQATSSRSTKLIHGGVRYLRQGNIKLVREALHERGLLLKNAPESVQPLRFVIPNERHLDRWLYGSGMWLYDRLAGRYSIRRSSQLSRSDALSALPALAPSKLRSATTYFDAQFDDADLALRIAQTAERLGATLLNYCEVVDLNIKSDMPSTVTAMDHINQQTVELQSKVVINASGIFSDELRRLDDEDSESNLTFSQGIHLTLPGRLWKSDDALIVPKTSDGRVLFAIPWLDHLVVGTTDTAVTEPALEPKALASEVEFVTQQFNQYLREPISSADVLSVFAGIRPLVRPAKKNDGSTAKVSREHSVTRSANGLITIAGGKWTTYRKMAEDVIDAAVKSARLDAKECRTKSIKIASVASLDSNADQQRLHPELPYTLAEYQQAATDQMAQHVDDVLARRTRGLFLNARASLEIAPTVARMLADQLQQTEEWVDVEIDRFRKIATNYMLPNND